MLIPLDQPFDLEHTLYSGQAFRWRPEGRWHVGVVAGNVAKVRQTAAGLDFTCGPGDEDELAPVLLDYLGLGVDLPAVYASFETDETITRAIQRFHGLRILRQDPWECLVAFIISSNSNIGRITRNVEDLATNFGTPIHDAGDSHSRFPSPEQLARAGEARFWELGLGYRAPYVAAVADAVAEGSVDLWTLREAPYQEAMNVLLTLPGVGDKVANCALLFSLDKLEAFPVDVWIRRALKEWYLGDESRTPSAKKMRLWAMEHFGRYAGYANQYLFHGRRLQAREESGHTAG